MGTHYGVRPTGNAPTNDPFLTLALGSADSTHSTGQIASTSDVSFSNTLPTVFEWKMTFPENPGDLLLLELGASGNGGYVGIRDSGTIFRVRAGDGSGTVNNTSNMFLDITDFPKYGKTHLVTVAFVPKSVDSVEDTAYVRLWIDNVLRGTGNTTDGSDSNDAWGSNAAGFMFNASGVPSGEPTTVNSSLAQSNISYWQDEIII